MPSEQPREGTRVEREGRVDQRMLAEFDAYPTDERWSPWTRWIDRHERTPWKLLQRADAALARASSAQSPSEGEACSDEQTLTKERNY